MCTKLLSKLIFGVCCLTFTLPVTGQSLRDFEWAGYTGFVAVYKQPACTKCFTELADYFGSLKSNDRLEFVCVAPMNSVRRRSDREFVCDLTHSNPENIKFITQLEDIDVEKEDTLLFPHLLYFESGKVIRQLQYKQIFTSTDLNVTLIEAFLKELHP